MAKITRHWNMDMTTFIKYFNSDTIYMRTFTHSTLHHTGSQQFRHLTSSHGGKISGQDGEADCITSKFFTHHITFFCLILAPQIKLLSLHISFQGEMDTFYTHTCTGVYIKTHITSTMIFKVPDRDTKFSFTHLRTQLHIYSNHTSFSRLQHTGHTHTHIQVYVDTEVLTHKVSHAHILFYYIHMYMTYRW